MLEARPAVVERAVKGARHTHSITVYKDGVAADATAVPTVSVYRDDGTQIVTAQNATDVSGTGNYSYTLTTTEMGLLDILRFVWTGNWGQAGETVTTYVEVAGGVLFSYAQLDAALQSSASYTAQQKVEARTLAESSLEDACGVAFVPRYRRESLSGTGLTRYLLSRAKVRSVRSVTVDGTALTSTQLADVDVYAGRALYYPGGFTYGSGNVVAVYEHGHDSPPPRISEAATLLAKHFLVRGPTDDRMTSMVTEDGTFGISNWPTEVNAAVRQYGRSGVGVA